ncbi:MAG: hypothetical protein ACYCPQ_10345 [Elusimicrobiota bacterium]
MMSVEEWDAGRDKLCEMTKNAAELEKLIAVYRKKAMMPGDIGVVIAERI